MDCKIAFSARSVFGGWDARGGMLRIEIWGGGEKRYRYCQTCKNMYINPHIDVVRQRAVISML